MADRAARVLVVDDDPAVRDLLGRFLTGKGLDVESAPDGESALNSLVSFGPDVVLLDLRIPRPDGIEVLTHIVRRDVGCGVIVISGADDTEAARRTLDMGAADYISKPLDLDYLETSLLAKLMSMGLPISGSTGR